MRYKYVAPSPVQFCKDIYRLHKGSTNKTLVRLFMQASLLFPIEMANVILGDKTKW